MLSYPEARRVAQMLHALAEPTRMRILYRLAAGPHHVGQLAELLAVPMVNMSHHLGVMRQAGLLEDDKQGRFVIYKLRPDVFQPGTGDGTVGVLTCGAYRVTVNAAPGEGAKARKKPPAKPKPKGGAGG